MPEGLVAFGPGGDYVIINGHGSNGWEAAITSNNRAAQDLQQVRNEGGTLCFFAWGVDQSYFLTYFDRKKVSHARSYQLKEKYPYLAQTFNTLKDWRADDIWVAFGPERNYFMRCKGYTYSSSTLDEKCWETCGRLGLDDSKVKVALGVGGSWVVWSKKAFAYRWKGHNAEAQAWMGRNAGGDIIIQAKWAVSPRLADKLPKVIEHHKDHLRNPGGAAATVVSGGID
ncbi:hypothetical protein G7Y89_g5034 [Cudoniella acicularis]|uniref:Uncharacterized protein n=1 Tax=Cudoniella acicularis TaxID=354080 RepID=A0A8H4W459_9HELO|nr:hypothetical protein G7Y89_g5034 [Cudoniella acicularis]